MSKNTTDLREQIYKIFRELGVPSADSGGMEKPYVIEAADEILLLISNREKLARINEQERYLKMLESGKWRSFGIEVTERLATLRKELDGRQSYDKPTRRGRAAKESGEYNHC